MDKILSQEEIDALMGGVVSGEVDTTPKEESPGGIKGYDLLNQERIIRGRMPTMEMINDRFSRRQSIAWTSSLREKVEFSVVGTEERTAESRCRHRTRGGFSGVSGGATTAPSAAIAGRRRPIASHRLRG